VREGAGLILEIDISQLLPALSVTTKQASNSSTDQGGGKRRGEGIEIYLPIVFPAGFLGRFKARKSK
jgi:hypothetical protein